MTKADKAIEYLLDRIQIDPDLQWHMLGTEAHALLMEAEAERLSRHIGYIRNARTVDRQPPHRRRRAELILARERIRELERELEQLRECQS
jgi:hypothetical protein